MSYPQLRLRPGRERALHNRHPWVFSGSVDTAAGPVQAQSGDIVAVVAHTGELLGYGHFLQQSQIVCRVFEFTGQPQTFDAAYWQRKLRQALALRKRYLDLNATNGYRLVNAEGDHLPGLIIDVYADVAVLQLRTPGMRSLAPHIVDFLKSELAVAHILDKGQADDDDADGKATAKAVNWLLGNKPVVQFRENNLAFTAHVESGQKTGFFLDQRDSRTLVGRLCKEAHVLNAFGYSGAFAAYALQGGAAHAVSVDISPGATQQCQDTMRLNNFAADRHEAVTADCFDYLRQLQPDAFDVIILDPPAFTKHINTVEKATRGYKDINMKAMAKMKPGGLLFTFSCSQHISRELFRKIVFGAAADARRPARVLYQTGHGVDHPVDIYHPEGDYLKGLVLQIG
jgi:23S rRNA (cytosine1962-C5)-methyltransferase